MGMCILLIFLSLTCGKTNDPVFDQDRAFGYLEEQCALGPRNPGSEGANQARGFYRIFMTERADTAYLQPFNFTDTISGESYVLTNVVAEFNRGKQPRVLLCAHWDTRPFADRDPDPALVDEPIMGANDGASGVAVLMEMANIIPQLDTPYGIDIVLFDGEDYGEEGHLDYYCIGSKFFADEIIRPGSHAFGVLLDMIGDADQRIYREQYSHAYARRITDMVWSTAREIGIETFVDSLNHIVYDDHLPLIDRGLPTVNSIDFDYPYWHTVQDTPDKCSPESLGNVGKVLVALLAR